MMTLPVFLKSELLYIVRNDTLIRSNEKYVLYKLHHMHNVTIYAYDSMDIRARFQILHMIRNCPWQHCIAFIITIVYCTSQCIFHCYSYTLHYDGTFYSYTLHYDGTLCFYAHVH